LQPAASARVLDVMKSRKRTPWSGEMISLQYGSPEGRAEERSSSPGAQPLPPPDNVTVQLFEWGHHPRVAPAHPVQDLLAIVPDHSSITHHRRSCRVCSALMDDAAAATLGTWKRAYDAPVTSSDGIC